MKILFAWRRPPPPFQIGGAEVSQALLARSLAAHGHHVTYLGATPPPWLRATPSRQPAPSPHTWRGVTCETTSQHDFTTAVANHLRGRRPDLVFTAQEGLAEVVDQCHRRGTASVVWLHSINHRHIDATHDARPTHVLAVSDFVQREAMQLMPGTPIKVLTPPFELPEPAATPTASRHSILVVNPVPSKGAHVIHDVMQQCQDTRFTLVEGWWDTSAIAHRQPNAVYVGHARQIAELYDSHSLLLVASQGPEGFGRVAVEAGLRGCLPIVSDIGALPQVVGRPDLVVRNFRDASAWACKITSISARTDIAVLRAHVAHSMRRWIYSPPARLHGLGLLPSP